MWCLMAEAANSGARGYRALANHLTAPNVAFVQDIVVHQARCMNHLCNLCEPSVPLVDIPATTVFRVQCEAASLPHQAACYVATRLLAYPMLIAWAVARETRKTSMGRSFLPPAPKICSAAASSMGCLLPTTFLRLVFIWSMSALTGATTSLIISLGLSSVGATKAPFCADWSSERAGVITLSLTWLAR